MKNKYLVFFLTCFLFLTILFICFHTLFSVRDVTVEYSVVNEESAEEVESLLAKYKGKSIFFVNTDTVKNEIISNRYLKVISVEKKYPCELYVSLRERTEKYYFDYNNGDEHKRFFLDEEFFVIGCSENETEKNSELLRIDFIDRRGGASPEIELKKTAIFPYNANDLIYRCLDSFDNDFFNVEHLTVVYMSQDGNIRIALKMVEGVTIEIWDAASLLEKKIESGLQYYLSLSESERICGSIIVLSDGATVTYTKNSTGTFTE